MEIVHKVALQAKAPIPCSLVKIWLPGGEIVCLTDGNFVLYDGATFHGKHPTYGSLSSISPIKSGMSSETPRIDITIMPPSDVAVAQLASPNVQRSRIIWWEGAINEMTGQLVSEPLLKFFGEIDKPRLSVDESEWKVVLECGTEAERLLEPNAERRLNHVFHQLCWPGERGTEFITGVTRKQYWRMEESRSITYR